MRKKNVLIGGSGFIGSALAAQLLAKGEQVVSVSHSPEGDPRGVESVIVDLYQESCPSEVFEGADAVFILLGQKHQGFNPAQEKEILKNLVQPLKSLPAHVYYCSTALVYGETKVSAAESTPCHPIDEYSQFKLAAESILQGIIPADRLTIFRLSNVYGSPRNKGFIGLLMNKLAEPNPTIRLNGDGLQRRDFIFLDDLISAIITVVNSPQKSGITNISTGESPTLLEVVKLVGEISGKTISCECGTANNQEPRESLTDNTRLKELFGYCEFTPLKDGLTKTLQRYKESN